MKSKSLLLIASTISLVVLGSCGGTPASVASSTASGASSEAASSAASSSAGESTAGYAQGRDLFGRLMKQNAMYSTAFDTTYGQGYLPCTGDAKMLVVPVLFSDTTKTDTQKAEMKDECQKAFFGESADTGWESVHSFYYKESFGKLNINGVVSDPVTLAKTFDTYSAKGTAAVTTIMGVVYYKLFGGTDPVYKASDFDSNGDGVIDGIYLVNEAPIKTDGLGWAFTTWFARTELTAYPIGAYSWSSIDFATRVPGYSLNKPDAHTYIHETGHLLGLNDYYDSYDQNDCIAGGSTMQDYNICGHESYSKYLWGWNSPTVVTDKNTEASISVELKPEQSSGDCLVLSAKYNGTALDEYLMIDYYTPTGVNQHDSETAYEKTQGVNEPGIRIYHVDKRIYGAYVKVTGTGKDATYTSYFDPNESEDGNLSNLYTEDLGEGEKPITFYEDFSTNSSKDRSAANFYITPELQLMRHTYGTSDYDVTKSAVSADFFHAGDTFGTADDKFSSFQFYSTVGKLNPASDATAGQKEYDAAAKVQLPYTIKVESLGDTAKLTLTKKA
jgi:M6 family metalloprotease-like protein